MLGYQPLPRTLQAALRDATHARADVRLAAVRDLARRASAEREAEACAALERALADTDPQVRGAAALGLADAGEVGAVARLLEIAAGDESGRVRQLALLAAGELGCLQGADEVMRHRVVVRLRATVRGEDPALRFQALIALGRLDTPRLAEELPRALSDEDDEVRYIAVRLAEEHGLVTEGVARRLRTLLQDPAPSVRAAAALALAPSRDEAALAVLVQIVEGRLGRVAPDDEQAAVERAGELGVEAARQGLARRAFGRLGLGAGARGWHALVALSRLGDERARRSILRDLSAWTRDTRTLAVAAAGRAELEEARPALLAFLGDPERADPDAVQEALAALDAAAHRRVADAPGP